MNTSASWFDSSACTVPAASLDNPLVTLRANLSTWYRRWRSRRDLLTLDARLLQDIGLDEVDAEQEAAKPFWVE